MEEGGGSIKKEKTAAEIRKSNKPLMEKRRRERINNCLDQLKSILMEVTKKESSYYSKLEKADILEMTVKYLKNMKRQQLAVAMANDPSVVSKYIAGFNECTNEVTKYLGGLDGLTGEMKTRLMSHLAECLQRQFTANSSPQPLSSPVTSPGIPGVTSPGMTNGGLTGLTNGGLTGLTSAGLTGLTGLTSAGVPGATQLNALPGTGGVCLLGNQVQSIPASPMQLVPAKLPSGDLVFLLTNPNQVTNTGVPVVSALPGQPQIINLTNGARVSTASAATTPILPASSIVLAPNQAEVNNNNSNVTHKIVVQNLTDNSAKVKLELPEDARASGSATPPEPAPEQQQQVLNPGPGSHQLDIINNNNNGEGEDEGPMWRPW